eukprot:scaffold5479_cov199-Amphora_coffeaeformis.AAC.90
MKGGQSRRITGTNGFGCRLGNQSHRLGSFSSHGGKVQGHFALRIGQQGCLLTTVGFLIFSFGP